MYIARNGAKIYVQKILEFSQRKKSAEKYSMKSTGHSSLFPCLDVSILGMNFCFLVSFISFYAFLFLNLNTTRPFSRHLWSYSCSLRLSAHPIRSIHIAPYFPVWHDCFVLQSLLIFLVVRLFPYRFLLTYSRLFPAFCIHSGTVFPLLHPPAIVHDGSLNALYPANHFFSLAPSPTGNIVGPHCVGAQTEY